MVQEQIESRQIKQIQSIMRKRFADRDERLDYMSAFFGKKLKSTKQLTSIEADRLIYYLNTGKENDNWGLYSDRLGYVSERKLLWSYLYQAQWVVPNERHYEVPDTERLSNFLKSAKSPVNKPLKQFNKQDWEKILQVFLNIAKGTYN